MGGMFVRPILDAAVIIAVITTVAMNPAIRAGTISKVMRFSLVVYAQGETFAGRRSASPFVGKATVHPAREARGMR
jgi:hypothetical protein